MNKQYWLWIFYAIVFTCIGGFFTTYHIYYQVITALCAYEALKIIANNIKE
jgi:hypothetical protein